MEQTTSVPVRWVIMDEFSPNMPICSPFNTVSLSAVPTENEILEALVGAEIVYPDAVNDLTVNLDDKSILVRTVKGTVLLEMFKVP